MNEEGTLVYEEERKVIDWFGEFLANASSSFSTSAYFFDKYYKKCVNELFSLPYKREKKNDKEEGTLDAIYLEDMEDFRNNCYYRRVLKRLRSSESFFDDAVLNGVISEDAANSIRSISDSQIDKMSKEEVSLLLNDSNYLDYVRNGNIEEVARGVELDQVEDSLVPLLKLYRLDNLQVKYAHTARIVYLTDFEVKKLGVEDELVKSILYTSALFHDVGRFYQGAYYNSYNESELRSLENNNVRDHADAGYYYSLLDMINLNVLGSESNEDLIIHALASVVVKKHQLPNDSLGNYDKMVSDFKFDENIKDKMLNFVLSCYGGADRFPEGLHARFSNGNMGSSEFMRENFTDSMLGIISAYTGDNDLDNVRNVLYGLFSYDMPDLVLSSENINILRNNLTGEDLALLEAKIASGEEILLSPLYNKVIREEKLLSLLGNDGEVSQVTSEFVKRLIKASESSDYYTQYDIVSMVDKVVEASSKGESYRGVSLDEDVSKVLRMSMGLVMDMDKLDILVQRAIKRYPNWKPDGICIKALKKRDDNDLVRDESLLDILEEHFKFDIKRDEFGKIVADEVLIDTIKHTANVNDKFKASLGKDFDFSSIKVGETISEEVENSLTSSYMGATVKIPYDLMAKAHPDLMERYKLEMDLILPPDLRENVFKEDRERKKGVGTNGKISAFPLGANASSSENFAWNNAFPGVWWQLDQFVMTNMRSMESLRFVRETGLLDRIGDAYKSEDCPKEFGMFLDEIIGFSKEFIDLALTAKVNSNGDLIYDGEEKDGYSPVVLSDKNVMLSIRDEAARRHHELSIQSQLEETVEHDKEVSSMFDDYDDGSYHARRGGADLESMMGEYDSNSVVMVAPLGNIVKKVN